MQKTATQGITSLVPAPAWAATSVREQQGSISWRSDPLDMGEPTVETVSMSLNLWGIDDIEVDIEHGVTLDSEPPMIEMVWMGPDGKPDPEQWAPMFSLAGARRTALALLDLCDAAEGKL